MYGIIDKNNGKLYAKAEKLKDLQKIIDKIRLSYPYQEFIMTEVSNEASAVGEELKNSKIEFRGK